MLKQKPCATDGVESVIVVDNIPIVGPSRMEKLKSVIDKLFHAFGEVTNCFYPLDENGNTKGYVFLEYKNPENAEEAVKEMNNHRLDKNYTFAVNLFTDFSKYENIPKEWEAPKPQPYTVQSDLYNFMLEPDAYDQFCVAAETAPSSVQVQFWQNTLPEPTDLEKREVSAIHLNPMLFSCPKSLSWNISISRIPCKSAMKILEFLPSALCFTFFNLISILHFLNLQYL